MQILFKLVFLFSSLSALAFPEAPFNALETEIVHTDMLAGNFDFEGIVKLSNCSGSIIRFSGQPDTAKALVLTNGHCLQKRGFLRPGEVWVDRPVRRRMKVADKNMRFYAVRATRILYATMTSTDAAIYQLQETYDDLKRKGIEALYLSPDHPALGVGIEIVSGYWERGYRCYVDGFVYELRESSWTFEDSIRYSNQGCRVIGGTSGSPIIQKDTRTVIGVNNTGNESGYRCRMNNPCEVDQQGKISVRPGIGYGQQTFGFYSCLTPDFKIDPTLAGCILPVPSR